MALATPDIVIVGHVCRDIKPDPPGWRPGGSVFYAASAAAKLGASVGAVTAGGREVEALRQLTGITVVSLEAKTSTTFQNEYELGQRRQLILAVAPRIPVELIPPQWRKARLALLAPVADEVPESMARAFPRALVGISAQGYMRRWDPTDGKVKPKRWDSAMDALPHTAAVFFSEEDLRGQTQSWLGYCGPVLVMTRGARGCELIHCGKHRSVAGFPAGEVDPTGAGDVFASAFMLRLRDSRDPLDAARFANCVASFSVTGPGTEALPNLEQAHARLSTWKSS
jgi:sugar/nucleoside kinase (ribokinase family)